MWPQYCKLFPSIPLVPKTVSRVHFHPLQHNPCPPNYLFLLLPLSFCPSLPFPELILAFPGVDNLLLLFCFSLQLNYKITQLWNRAEDYGEISGWREAENSPRHCHSFLSGEWQKWHFWASKSYPFLQLHLSLNLYYWEGLANLAWPMCRPPEKYDFRN